MNKDSAIRTALENLHFLREELSASLAGDDSFPRRISDAEKHKALIESIDKLMDSIAVISDVKYEDASNREPNCDDEEYVILTGQRPATQKNAGLDSAKDMQIRFDDQFAAIKAQLDKKDAQLKELKVGLAESVMEQKRLLQARDDLAEENRKIRKDLSDDRIKIRTLSLDIENFKKKENTILEENVQLKRFNFLLENTDTERKKELKELNELLRETGTSLENALTEQKKSAEHLEQERKKHSSDLEKLKFIERQFNAAQDRESEMIETIENLQREKVTLKEKNELLSRGFEQYVRYPLRQFPGSSDESVLEPRKFQPFLPFCFPERLPGALKIRWVRTMTLDKTISSGNSSPDFSAAQGRKSFATIRHLAYSLPGIIKVARNNMACRFDSLPDIVASPADDGAIPATSANHLPDEFNFPASCYSNALIPGLMPFRLLAHRPQNNMQISAKPEFSVRSFSVDLFIAFLSAGILQHHAGELREIPLKTPDGTKFDREFSEKIIGITKTVIESLAFSSKKPLQFAMIKFKRCDMDPGFRRGGRLHTVLKSFEESITSMVERYDLVAPRNEIRDDKP